MLHLTLLIFLQNRYDVALRDYKKGKFLLETRPSQLVPVTINTATQRRQQRRIIDKVWGTVEKVISDMKIGLLAQLAEPARGIEAQERTIEYVARLSRARSID